MPRVAKPIGNLILDGWEECSHRVFRRIRLWSAPMTVVVDDAGFVTTRGVHIVCKCDLPRHILGTYDQRIKPEILEDDMLIRLRELTSGITGVAA